MFGEARRQAVGVAVAGLVWVGAVACGASGGGSGEQDGKAPAEAAEAGKRTAGPAALTEAQLKAAAFTDGESVGTYTASDYTLGGPHSDDYTAAPAVCQPLVSLASDVTAYRPKAAVSRRVEIPGETPGPTIAVQLRSYAGGDAARVMKAVGKAGKECAGGFTEERAVAEGEYLKVEPVQPPAFGDEARAYHFTILDVKGKLTLHEYLTVVRSGSATLSFRGEITDTKDIGGVPREILDAQWEKFETAVGGR
ncbi:hypothetical protein [Streptomyces sp. H27-C3]|uniref:hypothetical protein n=1 Tax=Streptomyces sp. H27-C3 TaxID=3046305 RepID=UPI0024B8DFF9|nr:hypothetical protein [Streptomyces sp. H27-C3]MDJ0460953.1 hypothetical protein [Streptomyces sp. H27-C3]